MSDGQFKYEISRIQELQEDREKIQTKTFTKWMNSHLKRANAKVDDLFKDLRDGKILMTLMEVISNVNLGKRNRGTLRVQNIENVNKALKYIQSKVTLENIGAEDIVDGNHRLTLGLIWTIILRFQIQEMIIETESGEKKSAKDALLLWCQTKTRGYQNVDIKDFQKSWRDGLAFNALIDAHCPNLINYDQLVPENHQANLTQAFTIAEKELGIPTLLDPEDIDVERPDDKSIMTYVSSLYLSFAKMKTENTGAKRVGKIVSNALEISKMIEDYEKLVRNILQWIQRKIIKLNGRDFPNSLAGMQSEMLEFKEYRTVEKPPKFAERSSIDEKLFQIIIKQKENNMKNYVPSEGLLIKEVEVAWDNLEKAEHAREMVLREELLKQERLEQEAEKFNKKASLRESWLNDIFVNLNNMNVGNNIQSIEAQINKEELIGNEINTAKERFQKLRDLAINLEDNNYHSKDTISKRNSDIQDRWKKLQDLISTKQSDSNKLAFLISILRTIHTIQLEFEALKPQINSTEFGKHHLAAEDLLEKHNLVDCQLKALMDRFNQVNYKSRDFLDSLKSQNLTQEQRQTLETQLKNLSNEINKLNEISQQRREQLIQNCNFHKLMSDLDEEEIWLSNQIKAMSNKDSGHDFASVLRLVRRHEVYESEINAHLPIFTKLKLSALDLSKNQFTPKNEIEKRLNSLDQGWSDLDKAKLHRRSLLKDAYECQKYYADADDAQQWMAEHFPLVLNKENGGDEGASQALVKRHTALLAEISIFGDNDIKRLQELVTLMTKSSDAHDIRPDRLEKLTKRDSLDLEEKIENNMIQIPVEDDENVYEEDDIEEENESEIEWYVAVSDYEARDSNGRDISLNKDDVYKVLKKPSKDWWLVETQDQKKGYAPANYLKLFEAPKLRRPTKTKEKKSRTLIKKWFPLDSEVAKNYLAKKNRKSVLAEIFKGPRVRKQNELHYDKDNIEKRQNDINCQYNQLIGLAKARSINLQGSVLCHQFFKECSNFMEWMQDKEGEFNQRGSIATDIEGTIKKYEAIIDDLAANSGRINYINDLASQIQNINPLQEEEIKKCNPQTLSQIPFPVDKSKVVSRHKEIIKQWEKLNKLKCDKEKSLAGASSIELFNKTGDELQDSISQKLDILSDDNVGFDKDSNEALKRKLQNLLRDVDAIKARMERFKYLGNGVKETYPSEIKYVDSKINDIENLYEKLEKALEKRGKDLNNAGNVHKFLNDSKENELRLNELNGIIENEIIPKDLNSVETCMQKHEPLKYEIKVADANLDKLKTLANLVLKDRPNDNNVKSSLARLDDKMKSLKEKETKRAKDLQDALEAQKFYKECDQIDSIISQQGLKLDSIKPQLSVDDVENALKKHANIAAFIGQIDNRVKNLSNLKSKLNSNPDTEKINNRNEKVLDKMNMLREKSDIKKNELDSDLEFAKFNENVNELNEWIDDKLMAIEEENYKDLFNLPEKLQKHKALEAEIKSNLSSLEKVNNWGNDLIKQNHPKKNLINDILTKLNKKWENLNVGTSDKENKLSQAHEQNEFNESIIEILRNFENIESAMKSAQLGNNLPSAKALIGKHNALEAELAAQQEKLQKLKQKADEMAKNGHFDKDNILEDIKKLELRCEQLTPIVNQRNIDLKNNLKWHQFAFDVDQELLWIEEHRPLATLNDCGRSLADAVKLANKHKKLLTEISGHKPVVYNLLEYGKELQREVGPVYKKDIETRSKELKDEWERLEKQADDRKYKLDQSAEGRQLLDDFNDIDLWITEKSYIIQSDKDLDNDQIANRVTKLKSINVDLATYDTLLKNISHNANVFKDTCKKNNILPELVEAVCRKRNDVTDNFEYFKTSLNEKQKLLENSQEFQQFQTELSDIEMWIDEKQKIADLNEFGEDLQQMEHLREHWNGQLKAIELGEERIKACNVVANQLLKNENSQSEEIASLQEDMQTEWNRLLTFAAKKNAKFDAAEEIHKFNKTCKDFSELINVENVSLPSKSKDRNAIDSATIRFGTFSKEMENMKNQLDDISLVAEKLQAKYPSNADLIEEEIENLNNMWEQLCAYKNKKNDQLQYCIDYLNLYDKMKEALAFLNDINMKIKTDRHINSVLAAEEQIDVAKECMASLERYEDVLQKLVSFSEDINNDDECDNVEEIQKDIDDILEKRNLTKDALRQWLDKSEQVLTQQKFLRDIHQINSSTAFQDVKVKVNNFDLDLEETQKLLINHQNFAHNISVTDDRVKTLSKFLENMKTTNHFDIVNISALLDDCVKRRHKLHDNYRDIELKLNNQLSWLIFLRDTDDKNFWIDEKLQQIKTLDKSANNLEDKLHLLQKYKAFEAEISANEPEFDKLAKTTEHLVKENHPKSKEIENITENILKKWQQLLSESKHRSTVLKEAKDLLMFLDELDSVEAWQREKEFLVSANELGSDLDHCMSLQAKLTEPVGGKQVDEDRIDFIIKTANELLQRKTVPESEADNVKSRSKSVKSRWDTLKTNLDAYKNRLDEAFKMHNYYSELGLISDQIKDRIKLMKGKDYGANIELVENLRRKQNGFERDLVVLKEKFEKLRELDVFGDNLNADHSIKISLKQKEIKDDLELLSVLTKQKTDLLNLSYRHFKIEKDSKSLCDISMKQEDLINAASWPTDTKTGKIYLKTHDDLRTDMNNRKIKENRIIDLCKKLKDDRNAVKDTISDKTILVPPSDEQLNSIQEKLLSCVKEAQNAWNKRQSRLNDCFQLHTFLETCEAEEQWLLTQDKKCDIITNNIKHLSSVEDVTENIESKKSISSLVSIREKKTLNGTLLELLEKLKKDEIHDIKLAENKYKNLSEMFSKLNEKLKNMQATLSSEKELQELIQKVQDLIVWIRNKFLIASDSNYEDKVNLSNKIKKHKEFLSEVKANEPDIKTVIDTGNKLISEHHASSIEIEEEITELDNHWKELIEMSNVKLQRLLETNEEVQWMRRVEGFISWLDETEQVLESHNYGNDLLSVEKLKRKQIDIEVDINSHKEQLQSIQNEAEKMINENNYLKSDIQDNLSKINNRFQQLGIYFKNHSNNLTDTEILYKFNCDVYYELDWIQDKLQLANKTEVGSTLAEADRLLKQHITLMTEIAAHTKTIEAIKQQASDLEERKHFAKDKIKAERINLENSYEKLCNAKENRFNKLLDNKNYQLIASEVIEIEMRINDKILLLNNFEKGSDEQSCQNLMRKIECLSLEIETENSNVIELSERIVNTPQEYQDKSKELMKNLKNKLSEVNEILNAKQSIIIHNLKYYQYVRESEEVLTWIKNQNQLVIIEEYGKDYDDCINLIEKFDTYNQSFNANKNKINSTKNIGKQLISERNPFSKEIENTNAKITEEMNELKENFKIRKDALQGALEVHSFVRESNDLIEWIKNKNIEISSIKHSPSEDTDKLEMQSDRTEAILSREFNQPLSVVKKLENNFAKFERDLEAVKSQIERSDNEANRLQEIYPDAKDHISDKQQEVEKTWNILNVAVVQKKNKLKETKQLQLWLVQYKDLLNWAKAQNIKITSVEILPTDVAGSELLIVITNEQKLEIDSKAHELNKLMKNGDEIKSNAKYICQIIGEKQLHLQKVWDNMCSNLEIRRELYEQNIDLRKFLLEISDLENWLITNETQMKSLDEKSFKNVPEIEEATKNHEDYMKFVESEKTKFEAIKRSTKLEKAFKQRLENEKAATDTLWSDDINANIKRRETQRMLQEKRKVTDNLQRVNSGSKVPPPKPVVEDVRSRKLLKKQASAGQLDIQPKNIRPIKFSTEIGDIVEEDSKSSNLDDVFKVSQVVKKVTSFSTKKRDPLKIQSSVIQNSQFSGQVCRKQILTSKGMKAAVRSWKPYYAALEGLDLKYYKDKISCLTHHDAPLHVDNIKNSTISIPSNYAKREFVVHLKLEDSSELYLQSNSSDNQVQWLTKLQLNKRLSSMQIDISEKTKCLSLNLDESQPISVDVSSVIDSDLLDVPDRRTSSSSIEDVFKTSKKPSDNKSKSLGRKKTSEKSEQDRSVTKLKENEKSAIRPQSCQFGASLSNPNPILSKLSNKSPPPVSLSLIKNRQLSLEAKSKSSTMPSDGDHSHKSKSKIHLKGVFKLPHNKKKSSDKSDEV